MMSRCLDRKEVRCTTWRVHNGTGQLVRALCTHIRRLFLSFGGPVCADRISNCPFDRVLTYKNLIYLLNLQIVWFDTLSYIHFLFLKCCFSCNLYITFTVAKTLYLYSFYIFYISHGGQCYFPRLRGKGISDAIFKLFNPNCYS